jgi:hypothetical protein
VAGATYVIQHPAIGVPDEIIARRIRRKAGETEMTPNGKVPFHVCFCVSLGSFPFGHHFGGHHFRSPWQTGEQHTYYGNSGDRYRVPYAPCPPMPPQR